MYSTLATGISFKLPLDGTINIVSAAKMSLDSPFFHVEKETATGILSTAAITVLVATGVSHQNCELFVTFLQFELLVAIFLQEVFAVVVTVVIEGNNIV